MMQMKSPKTQMCGRWIEIQRIGERENDALKKRE